MAGISIDMTVDDLLERRFQLLSLRYPGLSATGSGKHTAVELALARRFFHEGRREAGGKQTRLVSANGRNEQIFGQVRRGQSAKERSIAHSRIGQSLAER